MSLIINPANDIIKMSSLNKGLIGHWPLDKESLQSATIFADKTPNENVGTKYGSVLKFDGASDYVTVADNASLDFGVGEDFTISVRFKTPSSWWGGFSVRLLVDKSSGHAYPSSGDALGYGLAIISSGHLVGVLDGISESTFNGGNIELDTWYQATLVYDNSVGGYLYLNGIEVDTITLIGGDNSNAYALSIGTHATRYFNGSIGDTRIYSRALTPAEVLTMYQGGVVTDGGDLKAHYKMGDKSGIVLTDETGTNNGELKNFADTTAGGGDGASTSGWNTDDTPNVFATDRMGQADRAMSFDGASDYIDCGTFLGNVFFASYWMKTPDDGERDVAISTYYDYTTTVHGFYSQIGSSGDLLTVCGDGTTNEQHETIASLNDNIYHLVCVFVDADNGIIKHYIDGAFVEEFTGLATLTIDHGNLWIGHAENYIISTTARGFNGSLADVRIYNRSLSQQERIQLYEQYRPKISFGSLMKGLVLDMPLNSKRYNPGNSKFDDLTPYENRGVNSGADVDVDHSTFIAANSDNVRIPDSESLSPTSAMTAMVWVKGAAQLNKGVLGHWDENNQKSVIVVSSAFLSHNTFEVLVSDNGTTGTGHRKRYDSSIVAFDSTWHLVGFSFDAGTLKLYVDGVEDPNPTKNQDDAITTIYNSTADVMIGCKLNSDTPSSFFDGDLARLKMWNRALTDAEWLLEYDKTKGLYL